MKIDFKKHWYKILLIAFAIVTFVYGIGVREARKENRDIRQDSCLVNVTQKVELIEEELHEIQKTQEVQKEFYKLYKPELYERAEEKVNGNDST